MGKPVVTAEGDEVEVPGVVITNESTRHERKDTSASLGSCYPGSENPDPGHPQVLSGEHPATRATRHPNHVNTTDYSPTSQNRDVGHPNHDNTTEDSPGSLV